MKIMLETIPAFGIAGNFTGHLEQAGEAKGFSGVKTKEENEPKAIFPTYIPKAKKPVPEFLNIFPFSHDKIVFPNNEEKLQIEPECALLCNVEWKSDRISKISPIGFGSSNDCSIRKEGAKKISEKKNWGKDSKGLSENLIPLDSFSHGGILDNYRIACFLFRNGAIEEYGEDSPIHGYSYIYEKLLDWCIEKFNTQKDEGPAEPIGEYLFLSGKPIQMIISIGSTRYTEFGKKTFLLDKDESIVLLYPEDKFSKEKIKEKVFNNDLNEKEISVLRQKIFFTKERCF